MKGIIDNVQVYGFNESVKASKYPMAVDLHILNDDVVHTTELLAQSPKGSGEDNFLTGIIVQFDLTFSNKAWVELERYHFIDIVSSQSTMHRVQKMNVRMCCNEYVDDRITDVLVELVKQYNDNPSVENRLRMLYNIPSGFRLTARMTTNYRQLKTIYAQRKMHFLPEWRAFCEWMKTLPHAEFIVGNDDAAQTDNNS